MEELGQDRGTSKTTGPQKDLQSKLTWIPGGSQIWNYQTKYIHGLDLVLCSSQYLKQMYSLVSMWVLQQLDQGCSVICWQSVILFLYWYILSGLSARECIPYFSDFICQGMLLSRKDFPVLLFYFFRVEKEEQPVINSPVIRI